MSFPVRASLPRAITLLCAAVLLDDDARECRRRESIASADLGDRRIHDLRNREQRTTEVLVLKIVVLVATQTAARLAS